jgi:Nucleotidyl transferase AbiEii toxin, Type IV TA system
MTDYPTWSSAEQALKAAATKRDSDGHGFALTVGDQLQQARFDRILSRVFADGEQSGWLLKGGTGLLARIPDARRTQDVDLAASTDDLDEAIADLERRVNVDLGDHLRFELVRTKETGQGQTQPGVLTRQVVFACVTGRKRIGEIKIDVVVGPAPTGTVETLDPVSRLELIRPLPSNPYRLYPLADQVAEKVCATMNPNYPGGLPSSRVKDLVDLVIIARTQTVDLRELQLAIATQRIRSRIAPFEQLIVPEGWRTRYRALAASTPAAAELADIDEALHLVNKLVEPALESTRIDDQLTWHPGRGWLQRDAAAESPLSGAARPEEAHEGEIWVRPHIRDGKPVRGHWRSPR